MRSDMLQQVFAFERAVMTPYTFVTILLPPIFSFYAMAVLVQLPRTSFYRAALLPIVCWSSFRASTSLDFSGNNPRHIHLNQSLATSMFTIAMRSTVWVLAQQPYSRLPICKADDGTTSNKNEDTHMKSDVSVSSAMWNAWNLLLNLRGIGWNRPQNIYISTPYFRVESRPIFALLCSCRFIFLVLLFDILHEITLSFGWGVIGAAEGSTIFDSSLPAPERYLKSTIITVLAAANVYVIADARYYLNAVLFTMLFRQHPSEWPPLFNSPWFSTSLNNLWGKRWHQYFRDFLVEVGGKPLERYFGKAGLVMGAFATSGLLHVIGALGTGQGVYLPITRFFVMQGVGVVMEVAWKRATGKRVSGFIGWLWVFFWLSLWGNGLVDAWARAGMLGQGRVCFGLSSVPKLIGLPHFFLEWVSYKNNSR